MEIIVVVVLGTVSDVASSDRPQRLRLALPPLGERARERAAEQDWELSLLDPADPDERAILIRLAHPDLDEAIEAGLDEVDVGGEPMNPRLHLTIHGRYGGFLVGPVEWRWRVAGRPRGPPASSWRMVAERSGNAACGTSAGRDR